MPLAAGSVVRLLLGLVLRAVCVGPSRVEGELAPYLSLWMREDHSGPGEKTSMRSPSGSKTKNA